MRRNLTRRYRPVRAQSVNERDLSKYQGVLSAADIFSTYPAYHHARLTGDLLLIDERGRVVNWTKQRERWERERGRGA